MSDTTTRRWEDSQSEPRCPECRHEARECVCDPPEAYADAEPGLREQDEQDRWSEVAAIGRNR